MRLSNPVTVVLRPLDRVNTKRDTLARRGTKIPTYLAPVAVIAQLDWTDQRSRTTEGMSGADVESLGTMILPIATAERAGYEPQTGDLLEAVINRKGERTDYAGDQIHVHKATPTLPWRGGFSAYEVVLRDRSAGR